MPIHIEQLYSGCGFEAKPKTPGELCGPCPFCGGKDRFTLFTRQGTEGLGRFWCRQCGKGGDAIQFLRDVEGLSFAEAKRAVGLEDMQPRPRTAPADKPPCPAFVPVHATMPGPVWQERSAKVVAWAAAQLKAKRHVQEWLAWERGIQPETAFSARLGWVSQDYFRPRSAFGLPPEYKENGKPKRVWIPSGLCIPVFAATGQLLRVKFRVEPVPGQERPKYIPLPQVEKCTAPLVLPSAAPDAAWQVVESELDALLLAQEAGHLVNVVAMGSASYRPDAATWAMLTAAPVVLISLDFDDAGNKAACQWWEAHLLPGRCKLWPVPEGKDPCDAWREGWSLAEWTQAGLAEYTV